LIYPPLFAVGDNKTGNVAEKAALELNTSLKYSRLCEEDDLYGLWKVVRWIPYFELKGKDWEKPPFLKHQWFEFNGKGGMKSLSSNMKLQLDDVRKKLFDAAFDAKISFKSKGFMTIKYRAADKQTRNEQERWRCSIAEKDMNVPALDVAIKKGDIIMTLLAEDNTILYFRLMRRVDE